MQLSITSIFSVLLFSLLFAIVLAIILSNVKILKRIKCEVILVCMAVPVLKMLFPVEIIPWTRNVDVRGGWTDLFKWTTKKIEIVEGLIVTRWEIVTALILALGILNVVRELCAYGIFIHSMYKIPKTEDAKIYQIIETVGKEYGKKLSVDVKRTRLVTTPAIVGLRKTILLLPIDMPEQIDIEGIIRHEVAHYVYGDIVIKFIWSLVKAWHFWNPVVYVLDKQLIKILEVRADEKAVLYMEDEKRHLYRESLARLANHMDKKEADKYSVAFLNKRGYLVKKRICLLQDKYRRNAGILVINYIGMFLCSVGMFIMMNCFIFEPVSEIPQVDNRFGGRMATKDCCFLVRNAEGAYDMYMDGVYCATLEETYGSDLKVYNSLEEVIQYEE